MGACAEPDQPVFFRRDFPEIGHDMPATNGMDSSFQSLPSELAGYNFHGTLHEQIPNFMNHF
jgi:hypothetical protein